MKYLTFRSIKNYFPGVFLCMVLAIISILISGQFSLPTMAVALLMGFGAGYLFLRTPIWKAGIEFSAKKILRYGIILLGVKVTLNDLTQLGFTPFLLVSVCIFATIFGAIFLAKIFRYSIPVGILGGVSIAICGASAALAASAALKSFKDKDNLTIVTVIAVTTLSTLAMLVYPILFSHLPFLSDLSITKENSIAILLGASIHDVAQVVGAGYEISEKVGAIATYTKLLRVSFLPFVILAVAGFEYSRTKNRKEEDSPQNTNFWHQVPWFAFGFLAVLLLNSSGIISKDMNHWMGLTSKVFLVTSIIAIGLKIKIKELFQGSTNFLILLVVDTLWLLGISILGAYLLF